MSKQHRPRTVDPSFSIVIPVFNEENYIGRCLKSIYNSNYEHSQFEVIVVDNGSHDRSHQIALGFEHTRVLQLAKGNVGAVRNHGAAHARGDVLFFIDADCLVDPNWLQS